jgi:predicted nuclease with TOPRIM domain
MSVKIESVPLINPENVKRVVSAAEKSLKDCWAKLVLLQSQDSSKRERFEALISFQPDLLSTLVRLESFYNEVCEMERELVVKKTIAQRIFKDESDRIARYKRLLDGIIDIGKSLGDGLLSFGLSALPLHA